MTVYSSTPLLMSSPFFLVRFVFLGLLSYFSLLILVVSSWHVKSSSIAELPVPGAAVFLLVLSIFSILFSVGALLPLFYPTVGTSQVRFECTWLFFMTMFELVACIALSADGPVEVCRQTLNWSVCASASVLTPASWICGTIRLSYFLALLIASFMHIEAYPAVWDTSFYSVPWFSVSLTSAKLQAKTPELPATIYGKSLDKYPNKSNEEKALPKAPRPHAIMLAYEDNSLFGWPGWMSPEAKLIDIEAGSTPIPEIEQAPWAEDTNKRTKRGVDAPFASAPRFITEHAVPSIPPHPAYSDVQRNGGSRFIEHVRESHSISRNGGKIDYCMTSPSVGIFPETVADYDKPIPLPTMSTWIRADTRRNTLRAASSFTAL